MTQKIKELREARAKLIKDAQAKTEDKNYNAESAANVNKMLDEAASLQGQIESLERVERESAAISTDSPGRAGYDQPSDPKDGSKAFANAFEKYLRFGRSELTSDERKLIAKAHRSYDGPQGAQEIATPAKGGYMVPEGFWAQVEIGLKSFDGVREAGAQVITTDTGNAFAWPTMNDTATKGRIVTEGSGANTVDLAVGSKSLGSYTYTSDMVLVSNELLQDTGVDLNELIGMALGERIGRALNEHFTLGDGAGKPYGAVTGAALGVTAAATAAVTVDELIDLKFSVNNAYRKKGVFMLSDDMLKRIVKLKDAEGRYILQPSVRDGEPDTILGHRYQINDEMAAVAAGAKTILFGDFYRYKIRDVRGAFLRRLDERFADDNQTAFVLFSRHDGILSDPGTNPIKYLAQAAA